ncbi:glycosyltransferase family 2 protein [Lentibacter sp. XHP0401]|uniref:glycosyltransferase family 2 protein n=1 Tax=Lentibacter sp. XHP0401 TaxID=2984334 RepID=UPI0021E8CF1B|nr:glycosyltransferase family 2 protein [Lentibacter sp. XHP0401]MCV2892555.1 glycosyltransferase family 2 protein [Lentibacter sp. XHP0401]
MTDPSVSVVVASHGRPESLLWCLSALGGQAYQPFEIVVVADLAACAYVSESRFDGRVKLVPFEEPNIAAARNKGVAEAAGEIIAFVDDDAAAEPMWLHHLVAGFDLPEVMATGGYVRGRNGISYQWTARQVDEAGRATVVETEGNEPFIPETETGFAVKTEGTNMAVRRDVLVALGGFDEGFHFFLDETDLNLRLAAAHHKTALCPNAEVHHAYKASTRRKADRTVTDLFDVGASTVLLLRKHGIALEPRCSEMAEEQTERLADQVSRGLQSEADAAEVLRSLEAGFKAGEHRDMGQYPGTLHHPPAFLPFLPDRSGSVTVSGRWSQREKLRREAAELAAQGANVSLYLFSFGTRFHHVRYVDAGYWEQTGGQFGKANRSEPSFCLASFRARLRKEQKRVALARG